MPRMTIMYALGLATAPAVAQDIPSPYEGAIAEHGQRQLVDTLGKRRLQQAQQGRHNGDTPALSSRARATCGNKGRAAANLGRNHPKVRQLYTLCAQAGY